MEHINNREEIESPGWAAWNAVPRDGPAVFLVIADDFDQGLVRGAWVSLGSDPAEQRRVVSLLAETVESGAGYVVDQVDLPVMMPEQFGVDDVEELLQTIGGPS